MKHGAEYARKIKRLYGQLRRRYGKPELTDSTDPLEQLVLGILARGVSEARALAAYRRLREAMVDYNELRVTPWVELSEILRPELPDADRKARDLSDALNAIYDRYSTVDLSALRDKPVREAREYLRSLPGVDEYAAARVVLMALGGHAVPIDETALAVLRKEQMISPDADLAEAQAFLERHIQASEAAAFSWLIHRYAVGRAPKSGSNGSRGGSPSEADRTAGRTASGPARRDGRRKQGRR